MNSKRAGQSARVRKYLGNGGGLPIELEFFPLQTQDQRPYEMTPFGGQRRERTLTC